MASLITFSEALNLSADISFVRGRRPDGGFSVFLMGQDDRRRYVAYVLRTDNGNGVAWKSQRVIDGQMKEFGAFRTRKIAAHAALVA